MAYWLLLFHLLEGMIEEPRCYENIKNFITVFGFVYEQILAYLYNKLALLVLFLLEVGRLASFQ